MKHNLIRLITGLTLGIMVAGALITQVRAGKPQLDNGAALSSGKPYEKTQKIENVYDNRAIYGKLTNQAPADIYNFKPSQDGEQTVSLLVRKNRNQAESEISSQAVLILMDPTDQTESSNLSGLPLPSDSYHAHLVQSSEAPEVYNETFLMQQFNILSKERLKLKKDATYYLVVLDPYRQTDSYAIKFGEDKAWTFNDVLQNFPVWFGLQTDNYAKSSPYSFTIETLALTMLLLGFGLLLGVTFIQETFSFLANRAKMAGYVLVKMQPYTRIFIWVSLWFMAIGGYIYFDRFGWIGTPFVLSLLFIPILLNMLYLTFFISPKIAVTEVSKKEAVIPFSLRKRWFFSTIVSLLSLGSFLVFLAIYLNK